MKQKQKRLRTRAQRTKSKSKSTKNNKLTRIPALSLSPHKHPNEFESKAKGVAGK